MLIERAAKEPQLWRETYLNWKGATLTEEQRILLMEGTPSPELDAMHQDYQQHFARNLL